MRIYLVFLNYFQIQTRVGDHAKNGGPRAVCFLYSFYKDPLHVSATKNGTLIDVRAIIQKSDISLIVSIILNVPE